MRTLQRAALVVALLMLAVIGARPTWRLGASARDAVFAAPGADARVVRQLADSLGGAPILTDLAAVRERRPTIRRLHVVGWGLDADGWFGLESIPVTFHPAAVPPGLTRASWPAEVVLGDHLTVDGTIAAARPGSPVALMDPTGVVDSTRTDSTGGFHLAARPKAVGRLLYVVRAGTATAETLGVSVVPPPAWRVLILESTPRSETTALRDWLATRHGSVAVRSAISRDRFHREFVNRDSVGLDVLSGALLSQFDVVVVDGRTLAGLGTAERAALRRAVDADGLGVLVVPDTVVTDGGASRFSDRDFFLDFRLRHVANLDERLVRPVWDDRREPLTTAVPAVAYTLAGRFGTESLIGDGLGETLAQLAPRGAGRVAVSLITGSARWRRAGLSDAYAAYWSRLLAAVADANRDEVRWSIVTAGPWTVHHPIALEAATRRTIAEAEVTGPSGEPDTVYLARDSAGSGRWRGILWPRAPGWHHLAGPGTPAFYVQTSATWASERAGERLAATARHLVGAAEFNRAGRLAPLPARPVPLGWAFGLFVLSVGVLWSARPRAARRSTGSSADTET